MHTALLHVSPVLAAEKSKVPFYIAGGLLATWAMIVSVGIGLRRSQFPGNLAGQRAVMAITAVLVLAAVSMAVLTSGSPAKSAAAPTPSQNLPGSPPSPPPPPGASGQAPSAPAAPSSVTLAASSGASLSYDTKQLSAKAGSVTVAFSNPSQIEHNVTIAEGSKVLGATATFIGGSRSVTLSLKSGTYTFYCSVPGHRQAGMEGTLTVQ